MYQFKTLYVRNVVEDLIKKKKLVGIFMCICAIIFAGLGVHQGNKKAELSEEQQQELDDYNLKLTEYDTVIADTEKSIAEADTQIEELQEYIDESIYMQIDSQNIQTVAVQYILSTSGNVGNIINTFISFINDGALKEELSEEDQDLKVKYWRDIVSCYQSGNTLNVVVVHHDMDSAKRIMSIIKERIQNYIPKVKERQGEFNLDEVKTSEYVKADSGITNTQNNHRNNLKNYINGRSDLNNKLINNQNAKKSYIEKNEPESVSGMKVNKKVLVIEYAAFGIIFGILVSIVCVVLRYILEDTLRKAEDLKNSNLNVIGTYRIGKGYVPEIVRSIMDLKLFSNGKNIYLNVLEVDDVSKTVAEEYKKALNQDGISAYIGKNVYNSAEELKQMINCGTCVLIAETGKTRFEQLEQQMKLCERFKIEILGCIVIE